VAPRQVVRLVLPAVASAAAGLLAALVGAAQWRCAGGVAVTFMGLGAAAASARTLPPSSSQRPTGLARTSVDHDRADAIIHPPVAGRPRARLCRASATPDRAQADNL
jgi:hypothetical protein